MAILTNNTVRQLYINLDHGQLVIFLPTKLSQFDVEQIREHFALTMRQCERRAEKETP